MTAEGARNRLKSLASPGAAARATRFFKTGPGQYDEGDTFIGINVQTLRTASHSATPIELALLPGTVVRFPADARPELIVVILCGREDRPC